jgi:hypothetical protein
MAIYIVRHDFGLFGDSYDVGRYNNEDDAMSHFEFLSEHLGYDEGTQVRKYDDVGEHLVAQKNNFAL